MAIGKEERDAVLRVMDRKILSGYQGNWSEHFYGGEEVKALEKEWAEYFGVKHAIACNSATSGLWMALNAIGIGYNNIYYDDINGFEFDEVIVTPYSMTCSASIPLLFGAKPVFADIEEDYYCLDPKSVEERITERTKTIIVVDLFGQPYNKDAINEIAERKGKEYGHKIYVIEDAAQAAGAKYKGQYAGTLGDIGVFSLNVHKPIQVGEGGIVVTNNDELAFKLRLSMNHSEAVMNDIGPGECKTIYDNKEYKETLIKCRDKFERFYKSQNYDDLNLIIGMNLRMTELSAAIAREQLKKLNDIVSKLQDDSRHFPVKIRSECEHSFYRYPMSYITNKSIFDLDISWKYQYQYFNFKRHYITPIYKMPLFKSLGYEDGLCPVCEAVNEDIVLAWHKEVI
ncbi:MAG: DegT/DnrJ/EryC1/StrS family aminotransferase [Candidatus Odinarchaeota archaeon]